MPNVVEAAKRIESFGADGITVHPRPDERHITYDDVRQLSQVITTEFNIEGNPKEQKFVDLVLEVKPTQVTLVPDAVGQLTSNHGWDIPAHENFLREMAALLKSQGIRVSVFIDPDVAMPAWAAKVGVDRVELYTEAYAKNYAIDPETAVKPYKEVAALAKKHGLGLNAGHDLSLENLKFFNQSIPFLDEVSIGHALISDALYFGLDNTVNMYKRLLNLS